ncbi:MAG: N-6 DNA methylase [Bacteroidota bacterium]|nr:N-6 DNA methylase [Bacteroidota bacterium]
MNISIQQRIESLHDHLYANSNIRNTAAIGTEVLKILHVAIFLEKKENKIPAFYFSNYEIMQIKNGNEIFCLNIASNIQKKFQQLCKDWHIYEESTNISLDNNSIAYVCGAFNEIIISDSSKDILGDTIESIRSQWVKSLGGQFFTDQRVTELAINMLDFNPFKGDDLVDLCSGTGGFLLAGIRKIKVELGKKHKENEIEEKLEKITELSIKGREIDSEIADIANGTIAALLGTKINKVVEYGDSLRLDPLGLDSNIKYNTHKCAASNPPFGVKISIKDRNLLNLFELGKMSNTNLKEANKSVTVTTRSLDILFLEQNLKILKPGVGRLAIVLPYQIVSGPQTKYIRDWLIKNARIIAIVDLPSETFQPHTGTKTVLLIAQKRIKPLNNLNNLKNEKIFMGIPKWIGHDRRGRPVFKKDKNGKLNSEILTDFPQLLNYFNEYSRENTISNNDICFTTTIENILKDPLIRLNALYYKPIKESNNVIINDNWKKEKIRDVVEKIFYPGRFKRNYVNKELDAVPFLGGTNISQLFITNYKMLSTNDPKLEELKVKKGWILVTRSGSTGIISSVPVAWDGFAISEHVIRIIPNDKILPGEYIQLFLKTRYAQNIISQGVFGSVIDEITPEFLGEIEIPIPNDKSIIKRLSKAMKSVEEHRQQAIIQMNESISIIESYFYSNGD